VMSVPDLTTERRIRFGASNKRGDTRMRFLCIAKSDEKTEAGIMPGEEVFAAMGQLLEEQTKAGVLLATEGLHPSSKAARIRLSEGKLTVTDGPFAEAKEVIASFALIRVNSKEEAIEAVARFLKIAGGGEAEIYQVYEMEDFGAEFTPELREQEERIREQMTGN
jgi:hypothetical protein